MKIGIEIQDETQQNIDMSQPQLGNPGIGGSTYESLLLAWCLTTDIGDNKELKPHVTIYHNNCTNMCPKDCSSVITKPGIAAIIEASNRDEDLYICNTNHGHEWYQELKKSELKVVIWAGCYIEYEEMVDIRKTSNIINVVCVSQEEYDYYYDDDIIRKMCVVNNMVSADAYMHRAMIGNLDNTVTYVGSLVPQKGFFYLAEIWKDVIDQIPDAELNVIGTGQLYRRDQRLGQYGISEEKFEKKFMPYLLDKNGNVLSSVHFLGILGNEKDEIFSATKVGVVNPSALTETFCISGVEMQASGIPVVTRRKHGLLSTVKNEKTGLLFKTKRQFTNDIVFLLKNDLMNDGYGKNAIEFVHKEFDYKIVEKVWIQLVDAIAKGTVLHGRFSYKNFGNDMKWIKVVNHFFRFKLHIHFLPSVEAWRYYFFFIGHKVKSYLKSKG